MSETEPSSTGTSPTPPWGGSGWGRRRGPPPWWPQGEAWPPAGRPPWGRMGRRFMWRIAWFLVAFFLLIAAGLGMGFILVGTAAGFTHAPHLVRFLAIAALLLLALLIFRGGRRFRRMALDVGDLVTAAGRIEAGDYGFQVRERGPQEGRTLARAFNAMSARL